MAVHLAINLAVAGDVFDGVLFYAVFFSHEMSWTTSGTESSQFLRIVLPAVTFYLGKLFRLAL